MNSVVGWLALVGGLLVAWVRVMTLWTAALLAGAIVLDTLLARRVRAAWRVALYAPIALRVLLPQSWTFVLRHAPQMLTILTPRPLDLAPSPTHAAPLPSLGLAGVALLAYAAVALTIAFVLVRARQRMRARIASATPVEGELAKLPLPGPLLQHAELGPMVVGLFAPRIILPASLLATGDAYALALVLRHEAAHLARRDPWLTVAMQTLLMLAWPVVPLWVGAWRVRQLVELACDEAALAGADEGARRRYGHALLDVAEGRSVMLSPVTAELHFGSVLRARIEALGWTKRWPLAAQGMVVAGVAAGFVACSSVVAQGAWAPPPRGEVVGGDMDGRLEKYCGPLVERVAAARGKAIWKLGDQLEGAWAAVPTDDLPPEQVAFCRGGEALEAIRAIDWSAEARNAVSQIAIDLATVWETNSGTEEYKSTGHLHLCPVASPVPARAQAPDTSYQPTPGDWQSDPGWACLNFAMAAPMSFQYRMSVDGPHVAISAHGQRTSNGRVTDATFVIYVDLDEQSGILNFAPNIAETWKAL